MCLYVSSTVVVTCIPQGTYPAYCVVNLVSDWSRAKSHVKGEELYTYVATENISTNPESKMGDAAGISTQLGLYCGLKRLQKHSRNNCYSTEPTRRQLNSSFYLCVIPINFSAIPPVSSAFLLGFPATILAVLIWLSLTTHFFQVCFTELEPCQHSFLYFHSPARVGYATVYFIHFNQSDELEVRLASQAIAMRNVM